MKYFIILILVFVPLIAFSKQSELKKLDINLSNYEYPYPVSYLDLNVQNQNLRMAYMDVEPENYNGKMLFYFMGKTLMEPTGKPQ